MRRLSQKLWRRFQTTRRNAPESALAEAVVFRVLQACKVDPVVADKPGIGGPGFHCLHGKPNAFMVESTSLLPKRVTEKSNLPNRISEQSAPSTATLPRWKLQKCRAFLKLRSVFRTENVFCSRICAALRHRSNPFVLLPAQKSIDLLRQTQQYLEIGIVTAPTA